MIHIQDWVIDADERCYIVGKLKTRKVKDKDGSKKTEDFVSNARYYCTLSSAFEGILEAERRNIVQESEMTLTEAIFSIKQMQEEFRSLFRQLEEETPCP